MSIKLGNADTERMTELDVRGYSRGIPLVKLKKTLESNPKVPIVIHVDTGWTVEDLTRYAQKQSYTVEKSGRVGDYRLEIKPI